jgi:hypothetical protein
LRWQEGSGDLAELMSLKESEGYSSGKWKAGTGIWGKVGVSVSLMRKMPASVYLGVAFDPNAAAIVPKDSSDLAALLAFATSGALHDEVRNINHAIYVPPHTFLHVPFDLAHWQKVAEKNIQPDCRNRFPATQRNGCSTASQLAQTGPCTSQWLD